MKHWIKAAALICFCSQAAVAAQSYGGREISKTAQAEDFTQAQDVSQYTRFSYQVDYAQASPSAAAIATADVDVTANTLGKAAHGLTDNMAVLYSTAANKGITGLTTQTTYFVVAVDASHFSVAASSTASGPGAAIDITAVTAAGTYTFTPLAFAVKSETGFKWQGSNDCSTYYDLSASSVTYAADGGSLWSFVDNAYKCVRIKFVAPRSGGLDLTATVNGYK